MTKIKSRTSKFYRHELMLIFYTYIKSNKRSFTNTLNRILFIKMFSVRGVTENMLVNNNM
jgi:hypothetical protein